MSGNASDKNRIRLQTILLPNDELCSEEKVYYHDSADNNTVDFNGYFNLFYIEKRKKYTAISGLELHIIISGYTEIILMHDREEIASLNVDIPGKETEYTLRFPYNQFNKGVFWFRLVKDSGASERTVSGYYAGIIDVPRSAKVFVDICTYKREEYVIRNMLRLTTFLSLTENTHIRNNIQIVLIDNGQTLNDNAQLRNIITNYPQIEIIKNRNTGGAGGFTRGMEEAIARKEKDSLTHVLLMDDDAGFEPDLFVRLFGVLETLKEEYKDLTIGGALWRLDYPFIQYASGEWFEDFEVINEMPSLDMRSFEECTQNAMCSTDNELRRYSGWWCCCYSLNIVTPTNLPIRQMFIHRDDIEFEKRNRLNGNPVLFINGFGVWHKAFDTELASSKAYYDIRNTLIMTAIHESELDNTHIKRKLCKLLTGNCLNNRYLQMHLIFTGIKDFLKGKEWIDCLDTEKHHKEILTYCRNFETKARTTEKEISKMSSAEKKVLRNIGYCMTADEIISLRNKDRIRPSLLMKLTLNGKLLIHRKGIQMIRPIDGLWEKGFRFSRYLFVQKNPDKLFLVRDSIIELINMAYMCIYVRLNFKQASLEQFRNGTIDKL